MDFYKILQVKSTATNAEIKKAYQQLATQYHPDKLQASLKDEKKSFFEIDRAYKTLRNSDLRKIYESERHQKQNSHIIIHENVSKLDFQFENDVYCYRCKCGSFYYLDKEQFESFKNCILACDECSLNIRVINT